MIAREWEGTGMSKVVTDHLYSCTTRFTNLASVFGRFLLRLRRMPFSRNP